MVLTVSAQVLGEAVDPLGEQGNLDRRGARICLLAAVTADDFLFDVLRKRHLF
jgi:hypothetical protein